MVENEYKIGEFKYRVVKPLKEGDVVTLRYGMLKGLYTNSVLLDYFCVQSNDTLKRRIYPNPLKSPDVVQTLTGEDINKANYLEN